MRRIASVIWLALISAAAVSGAARSQPVSPAGVVSTFVKIKGVDAVVSRPAARNAHSGVAIVIMHDEADSLDNPEAPRLAAAGYVVISSNARTGPDPEDHDTNWDNVLADVRTVATYARALPGISKLVLLGHSSGAPLMAAYQNIAENGVAACQDARKVFKCPDSLAGLPKADGVILLDPIFGVGANVLASVDPAITDPAPRVRNPALDMFAPKNGFSKDGAHYSPAFLKAYFAAEARKNNAMIAAAEARYREIKAGRGRFLDDEPFIAPGASRRPRIWPPALDLLAHTKNAWPLLKADGSVSTQVVHSVRPPMGVVMTSGKLGGDGTLDTSVKRFLNTFATRALPGYAVD